MKLLRKMWLAWRTYQSMLDCSHSQDNLYRYVWEGAVYRDNPPRIEICLHCGSTRSVYLTEPGQWLAPVIWRSR